MTDRTQPTRTVANQTVAPGSVATAPAAAEHLTQTDYEAQAAFRYALRRFLHFSEEITRVHAMTPQRYQALLAIRAAPHSLSLTITELAEHLLIRHHSAVALVDRLVAQGLVQRQASTADRRQVCVLLTPRGVEVLEQLVLAHRAELRQQWRRLQRPLERLLAIRKDEQDDAKVESMQVKSSPSA